MVKINTMPATHVNNNGSTEGNFTRSSQTSENNSSSSSSEIACNTRSDTCSNPISSLSDPLQGAIPKARRNQMNEERPILSLAPDINEDCDEEHDSVFIDNKYKSKVVDKKEEGKVSDPSVLSELFSTIPSEAAVVQEDDLDCLANSEDLDNISHHCDYGNCLNEGGNRLSLADELRYTQHDMLFDEDFRLGHNSDTEGVITRPPRCHNNQDDENPTNKNEDSSEIWIVHEEGGSELNTGMRAASRRFQSNIRSNISFLDGSSCKCCILM